MDIENQGLNHIQKENKNSFTFCLWLNSNPNLYVISSFKVATFWFNLVPINSYECYLVHELTQSKSPSVL